MIKSLVIFLIIIGFIPVAVLSQPEDRQLQLSVSRCYPVNEIGPGWWGQWVRPEWGGTVGLSKPLHTPFSLEWVTSASLRFYPVNPPDLSMVGEGMGFVHDADYWGLLPILTGVRVHVVETLVVQFNGVVQGGIGA